MVHHRVNIQLLAGKMRALFFQDLRLRVVSATITLLEDHQGKEVLSINLMLREQINHLWHYIQIKVLIPELMLPNNLNFSEKEGNLKVEISITIFIMTKIKNINLLSSNHLLQFQ